jgi:hypothetical protein
VFDDFLKLIVETKRRVLYFKKAGFMFTAVPLR